MDKFKNSQTHRPIIINQYFTPVKGHLEEVNSIPIEYFNNCFFVAGIKTYFYFINQKSSKQPLDWNRSKWHAVQFIHLVEKHFARDSSPKFYASCLNMAAPYLREICKKELQRPPIFWINWRKVAGALPVLLEGVLLVKEIAHEVGIEDVSYFNRLFKKYMGVSPKAFQGIIFP